MTPSEQAAYEEGRKNGEKYKGDAKRTWYLHGYDDGYKRGIEDAIAQLHILTFAEVVEPPKWRDMCHDCGIKEYTVKRPDMLRGITVAMGTCPLCRQEAGIVPAEDWRNACRTDREPRESEID